MMNPYKHNWILYFWLFLDKISFKTEENSPILSVISLIGGFGRPGWQRRIFCGLRSRCTIPFSYNAFRAEAVKQQHSKRPPVKGANYSREFFRWGDWRQHHRSNHHPTAFNRFQPLFDGCRRTLEETVPMKYLCWPRPKKPLQLSFSRSKGNGSLL